MITLLFTTTWIHNILLGQDIPTLLVLIIWLSNLGFILFALTQTQLNLTMPNINHYTKFFEGVVGYIPLDFAFTQLVIIINYSNAALTFAVTAFLALLYFGF